MLFISQPTFFPWIGYFDLIDQSESFVFLDDVKFEKQSWQNRNNFKTQDGLNFFTVLVLKDKNNLIKDIKIFHPERIKKKFKSFLLSNYSKSKFFEKYYPLFTNTFNEGADTGLLAKLNINLIIFCLKVLNLKKKFYLSSNLHIYKKKSERIINICQSLQKTNYISSLGAKEYLLSDKEKFLKNNIKIFLHNYSHPTYNQLYGKFMPYACILDLIMNEGSNSMNIIKLGRKNKILL